MLPARRVRGWSVLGVLALSACSLSDINRSRSTREPTPGAGDWVRYRLAFHDHVAAARARSCFHHCLTAEDVSTEETLLECIRPCPGFEATPGARCVGEEDSLPRAVCIERRVDSHGGRRGRRERWAAVGVGVALAVGLAVMVAFAGEPTRSPTD